MIWLSIVLTLASPIFAQADSKSCLSVFKSVDHALRAERLIKKIRKKESKFDKENPMIEQNWMEVNLEENAELVLFFPHEVADEISKSGFKNQHQTGFSLGDGTYHPEKRINAEDRIAGENLGESSIDLEFRPKSAYVNFYVDQELAHQRLGVSGYGDVAAVLYDEIKPHSLLVSDDSMVASRYADGSGQFLARSTFKRKRLPIPRKHYFYEAVIYGEVGFQNVAYFLISDPSLVKDLKKYKIPIYEMIVNTDYGREVFLQGKLLFDPES